MSTNFSRRISGPYILLTGGAGYVGSHTALEFLKNGYNVIIVDDLSNSTRFIVDRLINMSAHIKPNLEFHKRDLLKRDCLNGLINKNCQGVIHFAALKSAPQSLSMPLSYWTTNINIMLNVLNAVREYRCSNFIFSSTAAVYGENNCISGCNEENRCNPMNPYADTKLACEKILKNASNAGIIDHALCLRYFNPLGADPQGLIGELPRHQELPSLIQSIMSKSMSNNPNFIINGHDWPTKDGTPIRDFVHIMDLAASHVKCLEYLFQTKDNFEILNVGSGIGYTVLEVVESAQKYLSNTLKIVYGKRREGDIGISLANIDKIKRVVGWKPTLSIEQMCKDSIAWDNFAHDLPFLND